MNGYWDNLRPFEKRVVVGVGALFFVVLNALFVWPHFSDLSQVKFRMEVAQGKLKNFQIAIDQTALYERRVKELEGEGLAVPPEEQALQFANAINAQAGQSGVVILNNGKINTQTNQFFIEKSQSIRVQGGERQLVDFLYNLGSGNSLIRVRDLGVKPDPPHHQLEATVKLVASYQKKAPVRPTANPAPAGGGRAPVPSPQTAAPAPAVANSENSTTK
jgi:hypothetical protein